MIRVAIAGSGGFVGQAVCQAARSEGLEVVRLPRVPCSPPVRAQSSFSDAEACIAESPDSFAALTAAMDGTDVVINAAGMARPDSNDIGVLMATNAALPVVLATAAAAAGVGRVIHVSSAAVQGRRAVLDESMSHEAFSPYSTSKAEGERALLNMSLANQPEVVVYRATSVQGPNRDTTLALANLLGKRLTFASSDRSVRFPLATAGQVADLVVSLATRAEPKQIVLHPWEGIDLGELLNAFADESLVIPVSSRIADAAVRWAPGKLRDQGSWRRVELYLMGQKQLSSEAREAPSADWLKDLAQQLRSQRASSQ